MDILEINFEKTWRGGERQTLYNMQGFRQAGFGVSLLCASHSPLEQKARAEGFRTFSFASTVGALFFLVFKTRRYGWLHVQSSHMLTYAVLSKYLHGKKIMFTRRIFKNPKGRFTRWKYRLTDKIIAISPAIQHVMEQFTGNPVWVISDIAEEKTLDAGRAAQLLPQRQPSPRFVIGTTAALTAEKAPLVMLDAIGHLARKRQDFIFVHFGSGPLFARMQEVIKKSGMEQTYFLMGFIENAEDIFSVLQVFVMSSVMEGLGSSVLDAFLYKVPVVSTSAGGLSELLQQERGILCAVNDAGQLAAGIDKLLADPGLRDRLSARAFDYVRRFHSPSYITEQYIALMNS